MLCFVQCSWGHWWPQWCFVLCCYPSWIRPLHDLLVGRQGRPSKKHWSRNGHARSLYLLRLLYLLHLRGSQRGKALQGARRSSWRTTDRRPLNHRLQLQSSLHLSLNPPTKIPLLFIRRAGLGKLRIWSTRMMTKMRLIWCKEWRLLHLSTRWYWNVTSIYVNRIINSVVVQVPDFVHKHYITKIIEPKNGIDSWKNNAY